MINSSFVNDVGIAPNSVAPAAGEKTVAGGASASAGTATAASAGIATKVVLIVVVVSVAVIAAGVTIGCAVYFTVGVQKPVICATNAYRIDDKTCACNYGYSGDGYNYCDVCGLSYKTPNVRIVGGVEAVANSWPATVLIEFSVSGSFYVKDLGQSVSTSYGSRCGGTIIDRKTILTAAHCKIDVFDYTQNGKTYKITVAPTTDNPTIESMYSVYTGLHDFNMYVTQVTCLPNSTFGINPLYPADNIDSWVAGWGTTSEGGSTSDILLNVKLMVYNTSMCDQSDKDWNRQICAGFYSGGKDTCQGDSGGSLYVKDSFNGVTKYVTAGVVSYGDGCARVNTLGIYNRVSYYIPWIRSYALS